MVSYCSGLRDWWFTSTWLPTVLTTSGWIVSMVWQDSCNYALVYGDDIVGSISALPVPFLQVGYQAYTVPNFNAETNRWEPSHTTECITYPIIDTNNDTSDTIVDTYWKLAMAFQFLALVLGGGASVYTLLLTLCCGPNQTPRSWYWAGTKVGLACLFQILSFVWFQTRVLCNPTSSATTAAVAATCRWYTGARADLATAVLWMMATLCCFASLQPAEHQPSIRSVAPGGDGIFRQPNSTKLDDSSKCRRGSDSSSSSSGFMSPESSRENGRNTNKERTQSLDEEIAVTSAISSGGFATIVISVD